jgi:polysaccharide pyruvyl transferase WcaK-like protein
MRYLIDGCYGDGNVGDECLLQAIVERIRDRDRQAEIAVFSADPAETEAETGLPAIQQCNPFGRNLYGSVCKGLMRRTVSEIRRSQVFILGGGELFRDHVGPTATLGMFYRMRLARWLGKRVLALGVGAQAATTWWGRRVLPGALQDAESVLFRDTDSLRVAQEMASRPSAYSCSPDLVFSLDWRRFRVPRATASDVAKPLRIGVAVKSLPARHARFADVHDDLPRTLGDTLPTVTRGRPCQIHVLPFAEADVPSGEVLRRDFIARGLDVAPLPAPKIDPLRRAVSQLDCLLAVPLHASIFAFACGVPAIGLAYDAKIPRLYESFGMESFCAPVHDLQLSRLTELLLTAITQGNALSRRLTTVAEGAEESVRKAMDGLLGLALEDCDQPIRRLGLSA